MPSEVVTSGWSEDENFGSAKNFKTDKGSKTGFHTRDSQGFQVTFENGFTVSVQFGFGNYCENKLNGSRYDGINRMVDCKDAEVAVLYPNGAFVPLEDRGSPDDVAGWVSPDHVAVLMAIVAQLPANKKFTHEPLKFRARRNDAD